MACHGVSRCAAMRLPVTGPEVNAFSRCGHCIVRIAPRARENAESSAHVARSVPVMPCCRMEHTAFRALVACRSTVSNLTRVYFDTVQNGTLGRMAQTRAHPRPGPWHDSCVVQEACQHWCAWLVHVCAVVVHTCAACAELTWTTQVLDTTPARWHGLCYAR